MTSLVLASASPRRRQLLELIGLEFDTVVTDVDEQVQPNERPAAYVERLAREKARAGYVPGSVVLGADTCVVIDDEILGKPCGQKEAYDTLLALSGRSRIACRSVSSASANRPSSRSATPRLL